MQKLNINEVFFKRAAIVFFIGLLSVGCFTFSDYGISVDEGVQRDLIGIANYNFIKTGNSEEFLTSFNKYHGPVFEIFLYATEKLFNVTDSRTIFLLRHGLNFFVFFIGTLFFYLLGLKIFKKHSIALLCCVMLVVSPRIFADSFYDSKDVILLSFCIIASYTAFIFIERQTLWSAFIHALCCGIVLDIRIIGLLIPLATFYLYAMQEKRKIIPLLFFISYSLLFTIAFWPVLWINPVYHFMEAFKQMSHYPLDIAVLYRGDFISTIKLPWHYLPVWMAITTPVLYIVLFLIGVFFAIKNSFVSFLSTLPIHFFLFIFAAPILAVIVLKSVVYDAWHHVFFVYPFFLLIAVYGFTQLIQVVKNKFTVKIIFGSTIISIVFALIFMVANHPFQNVYFNFLAGKNIRQNFELDYAGLSYKQGLEYILATDKSKHIYIASDIGICVLNFGIIPIEDRERLVWTTDLKLNFGRIPVEDRNPARLAEELKSADYFLTNFRWHPNDYNIGTSVFKIMVGDEKIMEVRKLK